jgi:hypothetical protein
MPTCTLEQLHHGVVAGALQLLVVGIEPFDFLVNGCKLWLIWLMRAEALFSLCETSLKTSLKCSG